jgi:hypothetical protein
MSVATADLLNALNTVWDASTLDATFEALRDPTVVDAEYPVLNDQEAAPTQPFPYCVMDEADSETLERMSGSSATNNEVRDVTVRFNVHARTRTGDARTAKQIAAFLAEEIMKVFGGHPTVAPTGLTLINGNHLITQYRNDFGLRTEDNAYQWVVVYLFRLDVPVMI